MSIKSKIGLFISIILILTLIGYFSKSNQNKKTLSIFNDWFNGWNNEEIEMRKTYHLKLNSLSIVEMNNQDYLDIEKLKKFKNFIENLGEVELWKIDKSLEIDRKYYNQIDKLFGEEYKEQTSYLKLKFEEGFTEGNSFKQITSNYINDQLSYINFFLDRNCKLKKEDEKMYNLLSSNVENSSKIYNNSVNDFYTNKLRRIKEFNKHFKNESLDRLIKTIEQGNVK
jgi:hypothetical protein